MYAVLAYVSCSNECELIAIASRLDRKFGEKLKSLLRCYFAQINYDSSAVGMLSNNAVEMVRLVFDAPVPLMACATGLSGISSL